MTRPRLVVIIGANGAGKTTWGRHHRTRLPLEFYNADVIAEGLGDADSAELQVRARALVDGQVAKRLELGDSFGFESTWSGRSRPQVVRDASASGYETHGIFLGTASPALNIARVRRRVIEGGHRVPESEIVRRWTAAFGNLLSMWDIFDAIHVLDSSTETVRLIAWKEGEETRAPKAGLPEWADAIAGRLGN